MRRATSGFTLLELLVVLVIIGLLAGFVGPKYFNQLGKSNVKAAKAQIDAFMKGIDQYRVDTGGFPTTAMGLSALVTQPANVAKWQGPYLAKAIPVDPWGNAYSYKSPGTGNNDYEIVSLGRDGAAGGDGEDADITSWQ